MAKLNLKIQNHIKYYRLSKYSNKTIVIEFLRVRQRKAAVSVKKNWKENILYNTDF